MSARHRSAKKIPKPARPARRAEVTPAERAPAPPAEPTAVEPAPVLLSGEKPIPFPFPRVTISQGDDIAFEIELSHGDITDTPARVILLGQFQGMDPTAAAVNLDEAMNGALLKLISLRRALHGAGEVDIIPTGRHPVMADLIAFLGLGHWNLFNGEVLAAASSSGLRFLLASHFEEFSTVLMGGRLPDQKEINVSFSLRYMLRGFVQALRDDHQYDRFRRVIIVEKDLKRLREIHASLRVLVQDEEFNGVRVTICSSKLPQLMETEAKLAGLALARQETNLLMLAMQPDGKEGRYFDLEAILHGSAAAAAIIKRSTSFPSAKIMEIYAAAGVTLNKGVSTTAQLESVSKLVSSILPEDIFAPLKKVKNPRIELVHDAESSRLPWETLALPDGSHPALEGGISRRFISERAAVIWPPKQAERLRILMVVDPTGDLSGAREEGKGIRDALSGNEYTTIKCLEYPSATKENLKAVLNAQPFDILHYSGHSGFTRENARFSGLLLKDDEYFTGADVLALAQFPPIVIFNSCEAARIRRRDPVLPKGISEKIMGKIRSRDAAHGALSIAEAFLIAGVQHYIGTFWSVDDKAAARFGKVLYTGISSGETIGKAVTGARRALKDAGEPDWANYIHYGNPDAVIFSQNSKS